MVDTQTTPDNKKILETERTWLTLLTEEDLPAMMEMAGEPDTFQYIRKLRIMTGQEYAQFLQTKLGQIRDKTGYHWAVWLKDPAATPGTKLAATAGGDELSEVSGKERSVLAIGKSRPAGHTFIGAVNLNPVAGTAMMQIGCQLKRDYWHQGFAYELTKCILDFGIGEVGLKTVYGVFEKENGASRRLLEKLGFGWQETTESLGVILEIHKYPID